MTAFKFLDHFDQTGEVVGPEKRAAFGEGDERIGRAKRGPVHRHGLQSASVVLELNPLRSYAPTGGHDMKGAIEKWMKGMGDYKRCCRIRCVRRSSVIVPKSHTACRLCLMASGRQRPTPAGRRQREFSFRHYNTTNKMDFSDEKSQLHNT